MSPEEGRMLMAGMVCGFILGCVFVGWLWAFWAKKREMKG